MVIPMGDGTIGRTLLVSTEADQTPQQKKESVVLGLRVHFLEAAGKLGYEMLHDMAKEQEKVTFAAGVKNATSQYWNHITMSLAANKPAIKSEQ